MKWLWKVSLPVIRLVHISSLKKYFSCQNFLPGNAFIIPLKSVLKYPSSWLYVDNKIFKERMPEYNILELTQFAHKLADKSGEVIRKYYRNFGSIEAKGDLSPVTIADQEAEKAIRFLIKQHYCDHGIQGEEFGLENENSKLRWVIDPIDGTSSFMIGRPIFGTLIALSYEGRPIIGLIDQPITGERWIGYEKENQTKQSFLNGKSINTRSCEKLANAVIATSGPNYFSKDKLSKFNEIAGKALYKIYGGDCYNYALLAMGTVDVVVESGLKPHDFMALSAVVEGAGGMATDWQGKPLDINSNGDVLCSGDKKVHEEVLKMLNGN